MTTPGVQAGRSRLRIRWHVVYYLLAAFDVLTVSASLYLSRRLLDIYMHSVSHNQEWATHMDEYSGLQRLAADANAPGTDVFESHDVPAESGRLERARAAFAARLASIREHLRGVHPAEAPSLLARLDAVEHAMREMTVEAETTFAEFAAGEPARAAVRMAAMDRRYARLLATLQELRRDVRLVQQRLFAEQTAAALKLQRFEALIAALIVMMVGAAIFYGRKIEREMGREAEAKNLHRIELERRIHERTKALRESEAALAQAASEWRRTFDAIDSPVMILDLEGRLLRANATVRALIGKGATDSVTGRIVTAMGEGEPWQTASRVAAAAREARAPRSEEAQDPATGRSWEVSAYLAEPEDGNDRRIIVVAKDTTRLLELRQRLDREENMASMGALVAGVAHEVRNPIFAISSTLDAFEARFGATPGLEKYIPVLRREVERLGHLMRDLLDYGKPPRVETSPTRLGTVIAEAIRACEADAAAAGVGLVVTVAADLPAIIIDPQRMAQVFQNVIHNAVAHTPSGGRVVVEVSVREVERRRWLECRIRDSGPGFRPGDLPYVFQPLYTRRPGGTGLGLAIAQRIVVMHGGVMSAANEPQGGALVTVRLPLSHTEESTGEARPLA